MNINTLISSAIVFSVLTVSVSQQFKQLVTIQLQYIVHVKNI